jgi:hypothetical protein
MPTVATGVTSTALTVRTASVVLLRLVLQFGNFKVWRALATCAFRKIKVLTYSSSLDLVTLEVLQGARSFLNSVVLHETIRRLQGDLGEPTKSVKNIKNITFRHLVA